VADSFRLGFGEPVAVSATTGEGLSDLFVALQPHLDAVRRKLVSEAGIDPDTVSLTRSTRPPRTQDSSTGAVAASSTLEDDGSDSEMESSLMGQGAAQEDDAGVGPSKATAVGTATTSTGSDTIRMAIMGLPNAVS
jgi:predicted GTPase